MQIAVVEAKFRNGAHGYSFSPNGIDLKVGDYCIVDTEKGRDLVKITKASYLIEAENLVEPLKNVVKKATDDDISMAEENYKKAEGLYSEVKSIIMSDNLEMKVVSVECNYNFTRLTINFTSENRVDFREIVKKLADKYNVRIELRQIGPRDATRILGGIGSCGKECCCKQGFGTDEHVSIKMAKNQSLSLNPNNISGLCGKLLCCLAYENPYYEEVVKLMPKVNSYVNTPDGEGTVMYNDLQRKKVSVKFLTESSSEIKEYDLDQIKFSKAKK